MKNLIVAGILTSAFLITANADAQTITETTDTGDPAVATNVINFKMTVAPAITLQMEGVTDTTLSNTAGNTGDIDFGTVNTLTGGEGTGTSFRVDTGNTGRFFVAKLRATFTVGGAPNASFGLERNTAGGGDLPLAQVRYADGHGAEDWTASETAGTAVPDVSVSTDNELGSAFTTGNTKDFEIGVYILDSQDGEVIDDGTIIFTASTN
ncbi:MAG: hypothetical protein MJE77_09040 [Proteobacteria bacterium]|nr:hypothetical protein [Pseudomonadota bacterium]